MRRCRPIAAHSKKVASKLRLEGSAGKVGELQLAQMAQQGMIREFEKGQKLVTRAMGSPRRRSVLKRGTPRELLRSYSGDVSAHTN